MSDNLAKKIAAFRTSKKKIIPLLLLLGIAGLVLPVLPGLPLLLLALLLLFPRFDSDFQKKILRLFKR